jgi:hypothetical protein
MIRWTLRYARREFDGALLIMYAQRENVRRGKVLQRCNIRWDFFCLKLSSRFNFQNKFVSTT